MIRTARLRLLAYITGVLVLVLLATGTLVYVLLSRQLDESVDDRLRSDPLHQVPGLRRSRGAASSVGAAQKTPECLLTT